MVPFVHATKGQAWAGNAVFAKEVRGKDKDCLETKTTRDKDLAKKKKSGKIKCTKFSQTQSCIFEFFHQVDDIFTTKGRSVQVELEQEGMKRVALNKKQQASCWAAQRWQGQCCCMDVHPQYSFVSTHRRWVSCLGGVWGFRLDDQKLENTTFGANSSDLYRKADFWL